MGSGAAAEQLQSHSSGRASGAANSANVSGSSYSAGIGSGAHREAGLTWVGSEPSIRDLNIGTGNQPVVGIVTSSNDDDVCYPTAHLWFAYLLVSVALLSAGLACAIIWRGITALIHRLRAG